MAPELDLNIIIRKFTLQNALFYHGIANQKSVIGKVMAEYPELRSQAKELISQINAIVDEINLKSEAEIKSELAHLAPELMEKEKREKHIELPELANVVAGQSVVMRFAPGPSGPLHIGHTRAVILNDEYVKRYSGKFILRFEDTNPLNIEPKAYDLILDDLAWLDVKHHEQFKQSDRFELYYEWAEKLLTQGHAYICTCPVEHWRELKSQSRPCPDRDLPTTEHLERWQRMQARGYEPGQVSMVIKTDLSHPNPAVRDFVGLRIINQPHPLTGDKYHLYPTYNFSVAIDDYLMGISHILRGKDHLNNTYRQKYIYKYLDWPTPEFLHYGWVSLPDVMLKTTIIKEGISTGKYQDWADIQLGTLQALARRGIRPEAFRKYWLEVGVNEVDIKFSWENLYAINKDLIDQDSNRYFFVWSPITLVITNVNELHGQAPVHPDDPSRGMRDTVLHSETTVDGEENGIKVFMAKDDLESLTVGTRLRLKDLCNVELTSLNFEKKSYAKYIGNELSVIKEGVKILHWVPASENFPIKVYLPTGKIKKGYCEKDTKNSLKKVVQFERFGFVNLGSTTEPMTGWFTHK